MGHLTTKTLFLRHICFVLCIFRAINKVMPSFPLKDQHREMEFNNGPIQARPSMGR